MGRNWQFFNKLFPQNRRSWIIYLFCVSTAALFWLFLTFNRNFESVLSFKLTYSNFPDQKILVNVPEDEVSVRVKARGFDLLSYTLLEKRKHITLDVQEFSRQRRGSKVNYFLELTGNPYQILQNRNPMSVISYSIDTLILTFDELESKRLPVTKALTFNVDSNAYELRVQSIIPDSIVVEGSRAALRKIEFVALIHDTAISIQRSGDYRFAVKSEKGILSLQPDSVTVNLEVEPIKPFEINIPIACVGKPDGVEVKFFPASAAVKFLTTSSIFKKLDPSQFKLIVDYDALKGENQRVLIRLVKYPSYLKNVKVSPGKAEYLIRTKE